MGEEVGGRGRRRERHAVITINGSWSQSRSAEFSLSFFLSLSFSLFLSLSLSLSDRPRSESDKPDRPLTGPPQGKAARAGGGGQTRAVRQGETRPARIPGALRRPGKGKF